MIKFPQDFFWGAATSSYQVEGNNSVADWWQWEKEAGKENSGSACRHYEFFEQDFDLAKSLNHNSHRLSIEWSRIEPEEGSFSQKELQHYLDVILALKARNIEPVVTLHHFTNPAWLSFAGGWEERGSVDHFLRYCDFVVRALSRHVRFWITINEPSIYYSHAYIFGVWPPQKKSFLKAMAVEDNMVMAHNKAYKLIHNIYKQLDISAPMVSVAQNVMAFVPCTSALKNRLAVLLRHKWYNLGFLEKIRKNLDFIGINYYSRQLVDLKGWGIANFAWDVCKDNHLPVKKNSLGWDIYPQGLYDLLLKLKKFDLPVMITENGICTEDDDLRWEYVSGHLKSIYLAMEKGVKVIGYLYWSLMDNFEWDKGFAPRFGLINIDYNTYARTIRGSAKKFAQVCKSGILSLVILMLLPVSLSWAAGQWEKQGDFYYLSKDTRESFSAQATGQNKFFNKYLTVEGIDFLVRGADSWRDYGRLDLEGNKLFSVPIRPGMKVEELHFLSGGNVGNSYKHDDLLRLYGDNYFYGVLTVIFAYQDNIYRSLSAPMFWDWFHLGPAEWSRDGARIKSLGNNPVRKDSSMFHVSFVNPRPAEPVKDILVTDSWVSDYPFTEIFALTLESRDTLEAKQRIDRKFSARADNAADSAADFKTQWSFSNDLDGWIPGCSANWDL